MLYLLGLGHWDFPCSVHAGSWRWTGKFTSHLWKSTWLPLDTSDPTVRAFWFACTDFYCLLLRLWNLPFFAIECPGSGIPWPDFTYLGLPSLLFKYGAFIQLNNCCYYFYDYCPFLSLSWFQYMFPDPSTVGSISHMLWDSVLGLFPLWIITFWSKIMQLVQKVLTPAICIT